MEKILTKARKDWINSSLQKLIIGQFSKFKQGQLTLSIEGTGETFTFGLNPKQVEANIIVKDIDFFKRIVYSGDIGLGESYELGEWSTDNLKKVIWWFILNLDQAGLSGADKKLPITINIKKIVNTLGHYLNENSIRGSEKNIHAHYDLSNSFYANFLDKSMTYSCAIFDNENQDLFQAQQNKYQSICEGIKLAPTDHLLEIGCGWGGFSLYAAKNYGCKITAITISKEQYNYCLDLFDKEGFSGLIDLQYIDYRKVEGTFDKVVSIEMIEAVGDKFLPVYFETIGQKLTANGLACVQAIQAPSSRYLEFKNGIDWIQKYIFPGSLLPSLEVITRELSNNNMDLYALKDMGLNYAKTLSRWRESFNENYHLNKDEKFDQAFKRRWNYYFSYCEAAFGSKNITVQQLYFSKPNCDLLSETI